MVIDDRLSPEDVAAARTRRITAMGLQAIEGNPLDADQIAMFEMFERERWSHERCRDHILSLYRKSVATAAE